jgi:UDP-glucose 4-epimerase
LGNSFQIKKKNKVHKILVTGGAGYIGSHTVVELISAGYEPIIIDNYSNSTPEVIKNLETLCDRKIVNYTADCNDEHELEKIFSEHTISGVIHFAAYKAVGESVEKPLKYYKNNIGSLVSILKIMKKFSVPAIVFSSSCTVYGQPNHLPVSENAAIMPANSPYGYTKQVCESILKDTIHSDSSTSAVLLRYFNPIGAHPSSLIGELPIGIPNNLVPFITQTGAGWRKELSVFGDDYNTEDGTCIRDYIHVVDLANAHVKAFDWLNKTKENLGIFNIGTGNGSSVLQAISAFEKVSGKKLAYKLSPRREGDIEKIWASNDKALNELKWKAKYSLLDAMDHAWKWQLTLKK